MLSQRQITTSRDFRGFTRGVVEETVAPAILADSQRRHSLVKRGSDPLPRDLLPQQRSFDRRLHALDVERKFLTLYDGTDCSRPSMSQKRFRIVEEAVGNAADAENGETKED